jgi:nitroreductase
MDDAFLSIITARHCKRSFLDRPVPRETLETVLRAAAHAPSSQNTQFWQVVVLSGAAREELSRRLCADFDSQAPVQLGYRNRPAELDQLYRDRGREADAGFYRAKGIEPVDQAARRARLRENYVFYGAPVAMIFHLPGNATHGTFLEMGLFLQNVMLGMVACGLGSCPQGSVAAYPDTIRRCLGLDEDRLIVCGLAVGYVEETAPINAFAPPRAELEAYTRWLDHAPPTSGKG